MDKKTNKKINTGLDYIAGAGAGSLAGTAGYGLNKLLRGSVTDPYYNPTMGEAAKQDFYNALKSKNSLFKKSITAGAVGAAIGIGATALLRKQRKDTGKDPNLPTTSKVVGIGSGALMAKYLHGNRGKLHLWRKGLLDDFDVWRPNGSGIAQFFRSEKWIPDSAYESVLNKPSIDGYHYDRVLSNKFTPSEVMNSSKSPVLGKGRLVEEFARTLPQKKYGGDPEINFVIQGRKKKLPIHLAIFPDDVSRLHPQLTNDFSTYGGEINKIKPAYADEFVENMDKTTKEINDKLKGSKVKIEPLSITPNDNKSFYSYNRKTAGGHIHLNFDVPSGKNEKKIREQLQRRINVLTIPIDATHPAGYARMGLERHSGSYGKKLVDERSLKRTNWTPEGGFNGRSNMEVRNAPSYVGDSVALKKKLHLMTIANSPEGKKLDAIADELDKVVKNESRGVYHPKVRKYLSDATLKTLNEMGVNDPWLNNIHSKYVSGNVRKIGE